MTETCLKKYQQEISRQKYNYLYERIQHHNNELHESLQYPTTTTTTATTTNPSALTESMNDIQIQNQLNQEFMKAFEVAQNKMYNLSLKTAQQQQHKTNLIYQDQLKKIHSLHYNPVHQISLPLDLMHLIEERCRWIGERIEYMYQYKISSLGFNKS